jgi:serine protease AprX
MAGKYIQKGYRPPERGRSLMEEAHIPGAAVPGGDSPIVKHKRFSFPTALVAALAAVGLLGGAAVAAPGPSRPNLDKTARVHPKLQYGAQAEPNKKVRVLVLKKTPTQNPYDLARPGSATVREDFSQFGATSMEVLQKDISALAADPNVLYVSPDGALNQQPDVSSNDDHTVDTNDTALEDQLKLLSRTKPKPVKPQWIAPKADKLLTTYPKDINVQPAWDKHLTGVGVTVAVLDTGVNPFHEDLENKVYPVFVNPNTTGYLDVLGHGTHVTGIINGRDDDDHYVGIAPDARVISVKIADDTGAARESDLLRGLLWVYENRVKYNIKVVNLSIGASTPQSYRASPIDAAVEQLWEAGVTVVASAGNRGPDKGAMFYAPGNDPFVITVGCLDDNQTTKFDDDSACTFGSRGKTQDGYAKPDVLAPGRKIVAPLAASNAQLAVEFPDRVSADKEHIRLSGTSMAAPVVSGAVAVLLQKNPNLTPNQIKWLLTETDRTYRGEQPSDKAGLMDLGKALGDAAGHLKDANHGLKLSLALPLSGGNPASFTTAYWDTAYWDTAYWDTAYWDTAYWDTAYWDTAGAID